MMFLGGGGEEVQMVQQALAPEIQGGTAGVWVAYFLGAFLVLAEKMRRYIYTGRKMGKAAGVSIREWLFDSSVNNVSSWAATIGAVWVGGFLYINKVPSFLGLDMPDITVAAPVAFMLGCLMETVAPNIIKLFASKLPFRDKEEA